MSFAQDSPWALVIVLGPLVVLGALSLWRAGQKPLAVAAAAGALVLAAQASSGHGIPSRWLYLAQHAGIHLALGCWFGSTLRSGRQPLISALASRVHRGLTPEMARYTRQVTVAWTVYFGVIAAVSLALFIAGEFRHWSVLANLLTPVFTAAMFVGEYLVRYRLHPDFERVSLQKTWQAFRGEPVVADSARAALDP
jgi:uncharacterized membrane protein